MTEQLAKVLVFLHRTSDVVDVPLNRAPLHEVLAEVDLTTETLDIYKFREVQGLRPKFDARLLRISARLTWDMLTSQLTGMKHSALSIRELISAWHKCATMEIQFPWIGLGSFITGSEGVKFAPIIRNRKIGIIALEGHPPFDAVFPVRLL